MVRPCESRSSSAPYLKPPTLEDVGGGFWLGWGGFINDDRWMGFYGVDGYGWAKSIYVD